MHVLADTARLRACDNDERVIQRSKLTHQSLPHTPRTTDDNCFSFHKSKNILKSSHFNIFLCKFSIITTDEACFSANKGVNDADFHDNTTDEKWQNELHF